MYVLLAIHKKPRVRALVSLLTLQIVSYPNSCRICGYSVLHKPQRKPGAIPHDLTPAGKIFIQKMWTDCWFACILVVKYHIHIICILSCFCLI